MVIIDTNIIIDHLRRKNKKDSLLITIFKKFSKDELAISVVTIQELFEGKSTIDPQKEKMLLEILSLFQILPYSSEVAELAGKIARDFGPIEFADATIAATAIINDSQLITLNKKDFIKIENLEFLDL